jgi:hypothetical protein
MTFKATIWKISKDHDGEVKMTLVIPLLEAQGIMELPTDKNMDVEITPEG